MFKLSLPFLFLLFICAAVIFDSQAEEADEHAGHEHRSLDNLDQQLLDLASPVKEIVLITSDGIKPVKLKLDKPDSSVFFVNTIEKALVTLEIDFKKHQPHCASGNLSYDSADGKIRSSAPIGPRDFALLCFPERGTYPVKIFGANNQDQPQAAEIVIE